MTARKGGGGLERHAWEGVLRFAGSILVLSVAFKNIGLDFTPVMQALTKNIAESVNHQCAGDLPEDLIRRLELVEELAHEPNKEDK